VKRELRRWWWALLLFAAAVAAAGMQTLFFALWKWEFVIAISCPLPLRLLLLLLELQGYLFSGLQGRHLFYNGNVTNRVRVGQKGSVKGNVFLTSPS